MTAEFEIPKNGEREYLRAFGVVALFVAAPLTRVPCLTGYTRDLGLSLESVRTRWHWSIEFSHAWWLADQKTARQILDAVNAVYPLDPRGLFAVEADIIAAKLEHAATLLGAKLTAHADALHRVRQALARVDAVIASANASGELRWFNRTYRKWRTTSSPELAAALPYALARTRLRAAMVRRIARGVEPVSRDLMSEIFPEPIPGKPGAHALTGSAEGEDTGQGSKRMDGPLMAKENISTTVDGHRQRRTTVHTNKGNASGHGA